MARLRSPAVMAPMFVGTAMFLGTLGAGVGLGADTRPSSSDQEWFRDQPVRPPQDGGNPATSVGRDFGPAAAPMPAPAAAANAANTSDFPDDEVHDWVVASARAAHSRAILHRSEKELNDSVRDAQFSFEQSRDYHDAAAEEKRAYDAYIAERQKALESVVTDPKYKAALSLRDQLADQIAYMRAHSKPSEVPREMLLALASQKLQYASDAHAMESAALDKDPDLKDARQKMVQASAKVSQMRAQFDASIRFNPQILQARRNLEDARVALITAEAYRDAAAAAGAVATDYAYYRHRWDYVHQNDSFGPYGYGYGYGVRY